MHFCGHLGPCSEAFLILSHGRGGCGAWKGNTIGLAMVIDEILQKSQHLELSVTRCVNEDNAKEVCKNRTRWRFVAFAYPIVKKGISLPMYLTIHVHVALRVIPNANKIYDGHKTRMCKYVFCADY